MKTLTDRMIKKRMEFLRKRMIMTGQAKGLTHEKTILLSQKLDKLMNRANGVNK